MDFNTQYEMFSANLARSAHFNAEVLRFRTLDLVFFPIFDCGNYYLVVYNLKKPSIVVLDHRFWRDCEIDNTMGMYEHVVQILNNLFVKHLRSVKHRLADTFEKVEHQRHEVVWQTRTVHDVGGVFLMRHMETWMGDERSWKTGFTNEGATQKIQLANLRKKYTSKISLSTLSMSSIRWTQH